MLRKDRISKTLQRTNNEAITMKAVLRSKYNCLITSDEAMDSGGKKACYAKWALKMKTLCMKMTGQVTKVFQEDYC
jgi:hypothetical protein